MEVKKAFNIKPLSKALIRGEPMKMLTWAVVSSLILTGCTNSPAGKATLSDIGQAPGAMPGIQYVAPSSTAPAAPMQQYTYVFPASENACAPDPQRFVAASGAVTYRVKNCAKDEYDYFPEGNQSRIDALVAQCRTKCQTASN